MEGEGVNKLKFNKMFRFSNEKTSRQQSQEFDCDLFESVILFSRVEFLKFIPSNKIRFCN